MTCFVSETWVLIAPWFGKLFQAQWVLQPDRGIVSPQAPPPMWFWGLKGTDRCQSLFFWEPCNCLRYLCCLMPSQVVSVSTGLRPGVRCATVFRAYWMAVDLPSDSPENWAEVPLRTEFSPSNPVRLLSEAAGNSSSFCKTQLQSLSFRRYWSFKLLLRNPDI